MNELQLDENYLRQWVGKTDGGFDTIDLRPITLMQTIVTDRPASLDFNELPPLWHWLYFPTLVPLDQLGRDGHPEKGDFLPPVALPKRMWAGGRLQFFRSIKIGAEVEKVSTIKSVSVKSGRTGNLCFVTVMREYRVAGEVCIHEEHDIVYREKTSTGAGQIQSVRPPKTHEWSELVKPSPVMLFRYSALTFNGHRIHYDRDYCQNEEGYEGLVFHGPLTATMMVGLAMRNNPGKQIGSFDFRAVAPLFDTAPFLIAGHNEKDGAQIWAQGPDENLIMTAKLEFA